VAGKVPPKIVTPTNPSNKPRFWRDKKREGVRSDEVSFISPQLTIPLLDV
jgi:hypothetical protein